MTHKALRDAHYALFMGVPIVLTTNEETAGLLQENQPFAQLEIIDFNDHGRITNTEIWDRLSEGYDTFLFLGMDKTDLMVLAIGFELTENYGIAAASAANYSFIVH